MGGGSYNFDTRSTRSAKLNYATATLDSLWDITSKSLDRELNPVGIGIRESRDSEEHPESLAIILGIDLTGSMGNIPLELIKDGLPRMIDRLFKLGVEHPQIGFIGVGDHYVDNSPLQVSQFESSDELIDKSLTKLYLEGGGGGNGGESYHLAWYQAAFHTSIDCLEKRGVKGVLITVGDERCHTDLEGQSIQRLYGGEKPKDYTIQELLKEVSKKYDVYHINVNSTYQGSSAVTKEYWSKLLGNNFVQAEGPNQVPELIASIVSRSTSKVVDIAEKEEVITEKEESIVW